MLVAVVGAGMAGLSCAEALEKMGHEVILFDKGRGPGGRMSTRRMDTPLGEVSFDHGAQYFTAREPRFVEKVGQWAETGCVTRWPEAAPDAWVGVPGMNAVIRAMAANHDVRWQVHVDRIERSAAGWSIKAGPAVFDGFDTVVLAIPAEQALPFLALHDFGLAREAMAAPSLPCWTGMFAFSEPFPTDKSVVRNAGAISWAARSNAKPGRSGPEGWVVQASPQWSAAHLEETADVVAPRLLAELADALAVEQSGPQSGQQPEPIVMTAHRWRYAMNPGLRVGELWNRDIGLGACGDWLMGPRIECAWLSGQALAQRIAEREPAISA